MMQNKNIKYMVYLHVRISVFIAIILVLPTIALSQVETESVIKKENKRPAYLDVSFGLSFSSFRDFATSPLIYSGRPIYTSLSHIDMDEKRTSAITGSYSLGMFKNTFNNQTLESIVNTISLNYLEQFQIKKWSHQKLNLKIGGQFNSTVNLRNNEAFFNNSEGVDIISTLFGSVRTTIDLSRKEEVDKKFIFIGYKARKQVRNLSLTMNIGLINSSYRNGFAYTSSSVPINEDDFFEDYEFSVFTGFRLNSALDYTIFLHNKNAIQLSYLWDAYRTGGHHDNFQMATHTLKCSLLFGLR
jgi:hypothetical protein